MSKPVTLYTGASKYLKQPVSIIKAQTSDITPHYAHPSSIATNLLVFLTDLMIAARSNGLILLKFITSQLTPNFSISTAASNACLTIFEKATNVTSVPERITLAFPIGAKKSLSKTSGLSSNFSLYIISFSKKTTGLGSRIADLSNALQSSAS
jgi:hypothetical protein